MEKDKIEMLINVWKGNTNALLARFHQDQAPKMSKSVDFAETVSVIVVLTQYACPTNVLPKVKSMLIRHLIHTTLTLTYLSLSRTIYSISAVQGKNIF